MTQEELDTCGFSLVIARTSLMQLASIAVAFGENETAAKINKQINEFEVLQVKIACGVIKPEE